MTSADYRIESSHPLRSNFLPAAASDQYLVKDRSLAVALAAKSFNRSTGGEIRVVHVPTGEIVYRKAAFVRADENDEP